MRTKFSLVILLRLY